MIQAIPPDRAGSRLLGDEIVSLLCHDIGYVRGICRGDGDGYYAGDKISVPAGSLNSWVKRPVAPRLRPAASRQPPRPLVVDTAREDSALISLKNLQQKRLMLRDA